MIQKSNDFSPHHYFLCVFVFYHYFNNIAIIQMLILDIGIPGTMKLKKYEQIAATKAVKNANIEKIIRMLELKCSKEFILNIGYTEDEFYEAQK